jgi:hypothetical protein
MEDLERTVLCVPCGTTRGEALNVPAAARSPCPTCGATQAQLEVTLDHRVLGRGGVRFKVRAGPPGQVKPHIEASTGYSLTRSTGRWSKRATRIDRRRDEYHEVVTDAETGETIHECRERLSDHRGHGDAKRKAGPE